MCQALSPHHWPSWWPFITVHLCSSLYRVRKYTQLCSNPCPHPSCRGLPATTHPATSQPLPPPIMPRPPCLHPSCHDLPTTTHPTAGATHASVSIFIGSRTQSEAALRMYVGTVLRICVGRALRMCVWVLWIIFLKSRSISSSFFHLGWFLWRV
jgi:hypothetical protein